MPIPALVDLDKLLNPTLAEVAAAVYSWQTAQPLDEVAFLSHLTGRLNRRRRACDVGLRLPLIARTELYALHRAGTNQVDKFGSDLAVTLSLDDQSFLKTSLFQLKKGSQLSVDLRRDQLQEATVDPLFGERAFVLAVDEVRGAVRLHRVQPLLDQFPPAQATKRHNTERWLTVSEWILGWLDCTIGPPSPPDGPDSPELRLARYAIKPPPDLIFASRRLDATTGDDLLPVRAWLRVLLERPESRKSL